MTLIRTPGTRLTFSDLASWCAGAEDQLRRLRLVRGRAGSDPKARHWDALELERAVAWIRAETDQAPLRRFLALLQGDYGPWHKPARGQRRGTKWEALNVETRNAIWRLARQADHAELGLGHNSRTACAE